MAESEERKRGVGQAAATSGARRLGAAAAKQFLRLRRGRAPHTVATDETSLELSDAAERETVWGPSSAARQFWRLLSGSGPVGYRRRLGLLALGILALLVGNAVAQVRLNTWNGEFFDSLERRDLSQFGQQLLIFGGIFAALLVLVVAQTWLQQLTKITLRELITRRLLDGWLAPGRAYRLATASEVGVNPDQRVQEDTRQLVELSTEIGIGLVQSAILLVSFIGVLWGLSSEVGFVIAGRQIEVPGFMVWCAAGYALLGSFLTWRVGLPMIGLNAERYAHEADFRFALVRVSESAESVALYSGEASERAALDGPLGVVLHTMRRLSGALSRLTWITSGYGWLALVVPILVAAPGYFAGSLTIGGLMMVVGAFSQVQLSLRYFVDNFPRIADWRAALERVATFQDALDTIEHQDEELAEITWSDHPKGALAFEQVQIVTADGSTVIKEASVEILPGERVLIVGESGSGKSTLMRAVAGLWRWGSGTIRLPPRETMMFMPQRPYLPLGTLRAATTYPAGSDAFPPEEVEAALERVGLAEFVPMLDEDERWDRSLSGGQQQRLAFARLLLHRPAWVFLDEATAALDEENQALVMSIFDKELPETTIVSIGHRPGLETFHGRTLELVASPTGAKLRRKVRRPPRTGWRAGRPEAEPAHATSPAR